MTQLSTMSGFLFILYLLHLKIFKYINNKLFLCNEEKLFQSGKLTFILYLIKISILIHFLL